MVCLICARSAFPQVINFGHQQHSGRNTASFGVLRTEYDDYTDVFYWSAARHEKDLMPTVYGGIDENYWNAGASIEHKKLYGSLIFYEQIANYKNWPSNMTDLGLLLTLGIGDALTVQARYYDFCYSGGKGTAMPGLWLAKSFGGGEYRHRLAAGIDWSFWYLEPWYADVMFARTTLRYDFSKDSSNGAGIQYMIVPPLKGAGNQTDIDSVAVSHSIGVWAGITKDMERLTIGVRPNGFITINAVNPTAMRRNKDGELEDYNPFAKSGNMEFLVRLPASISYRITDSVEIVASVIFGLYYANFDHKDYDGLGGNNNRGWVNEKGAGLGLNFTINERCTLQIGSCFTRIPELKEDHVDDQFRDHQYTAKNVSAKNIADAPLSISGKFRF